MNRTHVFNLFSRDSQQLNSASPISCAIAAKAQNMAEFLHPACWISVLEVIELLEEFF